MKWQKITIGSIGRIVTGKTPSTKSAGYWDGEYMFVTPSDLEYRQYYCRSTERFVSEEARARLKNQFIPGNAVMFTSIGNTIGKCAISPSVCLTNQQINSVIVNAQNDFRFLYYALCNDVERIKILGGGSATPIVNKTSFEQIELSVPNPSTQRRIASVLSAYDDLIENNLRRIRLLEESARLLYKEWFVRLRFPGYEHTRIIDSVPEGWQKLKLADIANITMGQSPKSQFYNEDGEGLPFHQGVSDFGERFVTHSTYCTQSNRIAEAGDILCSVRAPVGRLNITLDKIVIGRGLSALRSTTGHQSYLFYQLRNHFFKEDLIGGGAIFASVTKDQLSSQELLTAAESLIRQFEEIVRPIYRQIELLFIENQKLRQARDILLPRLMSGEVEV